MKSSINLSTKKFKPFFFAVLFMAGFFSNAFAQIPKQQGRCSATADQVYFVASGQMVMDVYPGSNGGNGYQLNIQGKGADNFEVVQESYMTTVNVIPGYTNATQAKWQIFFNAGFERIICSIKMKNKCTGQTQTYPLTVGVKLLNQ
jgi:hypothetical protein